MLKILHLAAQAPEATSGGGIGVLQSAYAITGGGFEVDYIGPVIDNPDVAGLYRKTIYPDKKNDPISLAVTLLHLQFDRSYRSFMKLDIDASGYDAVFVDFAKLDYTIRKVLSSGFAGRIILRAHNVEKDFLRVNYEKNRNLLNLLQYVSIEKKERYMLEKADRVLAITENDRNRLFLLYGIDQEKIDIVPVGVTRPAVMLKDPEPWVRKAAASAGRRLRVLFTGSLWFGANAEGAAWFIREVYPRVSEVCELTLAGAHPSDTIKKLCRDCGARLVDTPPSMEPYFAEADMAAVPVFAGGGMKVKIAEAMSYGLPVVTTSHGIIGYEARHGRECFIADTAEGFANAILSYAHMDAEEKAALCSRVYSLYEEKYSIDAVSLKYREAVEGRKALP